MFIIFFSQIYFVKGLDLFSEDAPKISENYELINAHLERLFFTKAGSIVGYEKVGSKVLDFFWEPSDASTATRILEEVKFLIKNYEPRITIKELKVNIIKNMGSGHALVIELTYSLAGTENIREEEQSVEFYRVKELN